VLSFNSGLMKLYRVRDNLWSAAKALESHDLKYPIHKFRLFQDKYLIGAGAGGYFYTY